ncbi:MAG: ABC transporter ATP-binding protein/permease [Alphaproteobacteria bacterium]|nr:ABC transporter ATP-binding protein/permease [Alphaproteobacteria bacterium]
MRRPPLPDEGARADLRALRALAPYLWPKDEPEMRRRVLLAMLLLGLAKLANVVVPVLYKHAVDALDPTGAAGIALTVAVALILAYGLARIMAQGFGELRDAIFVKVVQRATRVLGLKTFRHLHGLSLRFHLDRRTGGVNRAIERGGKGIEFILNFMLFNIVPTFIEILLVCGILWWLYDPRFAAATFATIAGYVLWTLTVTEWRTQYRRTMNATETETSAKAVDSLLNYETVKYFGNEEHEARRFEKSLRRYEDAAIKSKTTLSLLNVGQGVVIALGLVAVMVMAAGGVAAGTMTLGDFVLVNAYLVQLYLPLNFLGFIYREIKASLADMEAMFALLRVQQEVTDPPGAPDLAVAGGAIEFKDVTFAYDPRRPILKGVSFRVPAGKKVAIVGPSGSGKSTVSRILFRFYEFQGGAVTIDGQDIRSVRQESVRAAIGMVPQDTVLFNDTISYNIAYGRPDATADEIEQAARLAHIHEFAQGLPDGYKTRVGERGLKLSGGEKQRIAIARTILKNPGIMLFDEATSSLDSATEQDILTSLREVSARRTTLTIAHRLSTVIDSDEILVMEQGTIAERGAHADLLARGGIYAAMWRRQQEAAAARETLERAETAPASPAAAQ